MQLGQGDHVGVVYSNTNELAEVVSAYLGGRLHRRERCWSLPHPKRTRQRSDAR
jgi:hypothetical protein